MITEDYAHILVLLKKIREDSEERGKIAEYSKLANYFQFRAEITFYADKIKELDDNITDLQIQLLKAISVLE